MKKRFVFKVISVYLITALFVIGMVPRVDAGFAPTQLPAESRTQDLATIQKALELKSISATLESMGYSKTEIQSRLGGLSDQQIHQFASQIDDARAGGDGLGVVIAILVIIILIIVILQLTGHKVIVK